MDLSEYLPSWRQSGRIPPPNSPGLAPAYGDDVPLYGNDAPLPACPCPPANVQGPPGSHGPVGPSGTLGSTGPTGHYWTGTRGPTGPPGTRGMNGSRGSTGVGGPTGYTGPFIAGLKLSVIESPLGNVCLAVFEHARAVFLDVLEGRGRLRLREKFLASIVPGSAFVMMLARRGEVGRLGGVGGDVGAAFAPIAPWASRKASALPLHGGEKRLEASPTSGAIAGQDAQLGARIEGDEVVIDGDAIATVTVAGWQKDFPDWDMPVVSDERRDISRRFWAREHGGKDEG